MMCQCWGQLWRMKIEYCMLNPDSNKHAIFLTHLRGIHYTRTWREVERGKRNKTTHDDVIKWKHFPRYRPFVRGIHRSPLNSPHKDQWRGALMFPLICAWIKVWVNNRQAVDLRRHRAHYDVIVMTSPLWYVPYLEEMVMPKVLQYKKLSVNTRYT